MVLLLCKAEGRRCSMVIIAILYLLAAGIMIIIYRKEIDI
jgi:hypothetical protein